jgi:hypothetical protein
MYFFVMMTKGAYLKKMPIPLLFNGNRDKRHMPSRRCVKKLSFMPLKPFGA